LLGKKVLKLTCPKIKIINKDEQEMAQEWQQNVRPAYPKGPLEVKVFSTPERALKVWLYL